MVTSKSAFQLKHFAIGEMLVRNAYNVSAANAEDSLSGAYSTEIEAPDGCTENYHAVMQMRYELNNGRAENNFSLSATCHAFFSMEAEKSQENDRFFKKLLLQNGAVTVLSIFRSNLVSITNALGISPPVIIPSINLTNFKWSVLQLSAD